MSAIAAEPTAVATSKPDKANRHFHVGRWLLTILAIIVALCWVFPVYWMISSSLLPNVRLESVTPTFFPSGASLDNYRAVLHSGSFLPALFMSLKITFLALIVVIIFAFLAALAISRFQFRGKTAFTLAILFIQMLPAEGMFLAQYKMLSKVGSATGNVIGLNSVLGISLLYIAAVVPFTIWMLRGFIAGVPAELEESAQVDGCSRTGAFFRITFPLLAPGLVASGVYAFLQAWNEFTIASVILTKDAAHTLPLWLRSFLTNSQSQGVDWGQVMAASTLVAIPVIIFFMLVQGRMTSGMVAGAVKG